MKKVTIYDLFLAFAIIASLVKPTIYTSVILLCAGILELMDVIPKLIREIRR